jgi:hypothetical protein
MIRRAIEEHPEASNREIARQLGVSDKTVGAVRGKRGEQTYAPAAELTRLDLHGAQAQDQREEEELVRDRGDGRLLATVDLVVERGNAAYFFTAGSWIPAELAHLPRRPAQDEELTREELSDFTGALMRRQRAAEEAD